MRLSRETRIEQIRQIGVSIAIGHGLVVVTPERIASSGPQDASRLTVANIRRIYNTLDELRAAVAAHPSATNLIRQEAKSLGLAVRLRYT